MLPDVRIRCQILKVLEARGKGVLFSLGQDFLAGLWKRAAELIANVMMVQATRHFNWCGEEKEELGFFEQPAQYGSI